MRKILLQHSEGLVHKVPFPFRFAIVSETKTNKERADKRKLPADQKRYESQLKCFLPVNI